MDRILINSKKLLITFLLISVSAGNIFSQAEVNDSVTIIDSFIENTDNTTAGTFDHLSGELPLPQLRRVPDSIVQNLKQQDVFWYANEEWAKPRTQAPRRKNIVDEEWFKTLMWILIVGAFLSAIIWYLATINLGIFRRKASFVRNKNELSDTENIFEIDYESEINKAVTAGNFRLATRLLFLRLLKQLSEKKIIQYKQDRTNFDYLMQLYNSAYYNDFFRLTRNYEFAWYGKLDPGPEGFRIIRNEYENFNNKHLHH